jgi:hypothetical protein
MELDNWIRVWADSSLEGVFVVYRRKRVSRDS